MLAAAGGFGSIYLNKEIAGKKHFTTWHGFFGLLTCIGVLLAGAGGLLAKYNAWIKNYVRPINVKLYHATGALLGNREATNISHLINPHPFSLQPGHDYHVPGLLLQLVQEPSGRLPVEMHVLVPSHSAHLRGQAGHPELSTEGGQANTSSREEEEFNRKEDKVSIVTFVFIASSTS